MTDGHQEPRETRGPSRLLRMVFAWLMLSEEPDMTLIIGAAIIIGGVLIFHLGERNRSGKSMIDQSLCPGGLAQVGQSSQQGCDGSRPPSGPGDTR